jgi:putative transposase
MGAVRRVRRSVKRRYDVTMALRWTAAAALEAAKSFRRLKAYTQPPAHGRTCRPSRQVRYQARG